jgi:hypothetical protein
MFTSVTVDRLYAGSVFKLIGIGLTCSIIPLSFVAGVLALFGGVALTWNAKQIVGVWGLALCPLLGVLLTLALTFAVGIPCVAGLWLYSKFRPIVLWARNVVHDPEATEITAEKGTQAYESRDCHQN